MVVANGASVVRFIFPGTPRVGAAWAQASRRSTGSERRRQLPHHALPHWGTL